MLVRGEDINQTMLLVSSFQPVVHGIEEFQSFTSTVLSLKPPPA